MRSKLLALASLIALWWILVNVAWVTVGQNQLTGGQLMPVLNLIPGIALTGIFIAFYRKLVRTLLILVTTALGFATFATFTSDWSSAEAVISVLEQLSGVMNADQHAAGVSVVLSPAIYLSGAVSGIAAIMALVFAFGNRALERKIVVDLAREDNRSLWDEQR